MSTSLTPGTKVTFTVVKAPRREAERKTIARLMRMQPDIRKGLKTLQLRRKREDNETYIRAGNEWTNRKRATRLVRVEPGATFTVHLTPQIIPDVRSVEGYLKGGRD